MQHGRGAVKVRAGLQYALDSGQACPMCTPCSYVPGSLLVLRCPGSLRVPKWKIVGSENALKPFPSR